MSCYLSKSICYEIIISILSYLSKYNRINHYKYFSPNETKLQLHLPADCFLYIHSIFFPPKAKKINAIAQSPPRKDQLQDNRTHKQGISYMTNSQKDTDTQYIAHRSVIQFRLQRIIHFVWCLSINRTFINLFGNGEEIKITFFLNFSFVFFSIFFLSLCRQKVLSSIIRYRV